MQTSTEAAGEQLTTVTDEVVEIVNGEVVSTTLASSDADVTVTTTTTTNTAATTDIPESNRNVGGRKLPRVFRDQVNAIKLFFAITK